MFGLYAVICGLAMCILFMGICTLGDVLGIKPLADWGHKMVGFVLAFTAIGGGLAMLAAVLSWAIKP